VQGRFPVSVVASGWGCPPFERRDTLAACKADISPANSTGHII
jgi:hypothetical protein